MRPPVRPPPPVRTVPPSGIPAITRHGLSSGLELLLVERHVLPVVDLELVLRVGAGEDEPARAGRATLTADLLDEGAGGRSATELADAVDVLGATLDTAASWDATHVALHVLVERLERALPLMADVVRAPTFSEKDVARKRQERLTSLLQERDEPRLLALKAFQHVVYGEAHPYGAPIGGTEASVSALDRAALLGFYQAHAAPGNALLVVAGDVRAETLLPLLERAFGGWADEVGVRALRGARTGTAPVSPSLPPVPPLLRTAIYVVDRPGAPQSEIRVGHAGVPRNTPDYFALLVANTALGGAFTSRLNQVLREEKGYTYGASSRFDFRLGPGPFQAGAAVATAATADAVREFVRQIGRLGDEPPVGDELERVREYLALGLPRRLETTGDLAARAIEVGLYGLEADYFAHYTGHIRAVTAEEVARVARNHLHPEHLAIVVAGDRQEVEGELRGLGLGPVHVLEPA